LKVLIFHSEPPVRIAVGKTSERRHLVQFFPVKDLKDDREEVKAAFAGVALELVLDPCQLWS
jgi:hypothetical protein